MSSSHLAVALGQFLALLIAATAVSSTFLAKEGVSAPTLQSAVNYALLAAVYGSCCLRVRKASTPCGLSKPWWCYALLALLDVEANFCLVLAYRYTSLTSVTLLDCFTIPVAVVLSRAALGVRYRRGHYAGAAVCLAGLCLLVLTDRSGPPGGSGGGGSQNDAGGGAEAGAQGRAWLGDGLVLLGATLYACCNVWAEWLLGDVPVQELLAMQGAFGVLWSGLQGLPLELGTLSAATWAPGVLLPFFGFGLAMFCFYSLVPYQLQWGGSALLNLSLLSSDLWTALARQLLFGGFAGNAFLFFALSFAIVAAGIVLFARSGDVSGSGTAEKAGMGDALAAQGWLHVLQQRGQQAGEGRWGQAYRQLQFAEEGEGPQPAPATAAAGAVAELFPGDHSGTGSRQHGGAAPLPEQGEGDPLMRCVRQEEGSQGGQVSDSAGSSSKSVGSAHLGPPQQGRQQTFGRESVRLLAVHAPPGSTGDAQRFGVESPPASARCGAR